MAQRSNKVEIRTTDLEKKDWQEAAGGARKVSDWLRSLANTEAQRLRDRRSFVPPVLLESAASEFPERKEYDTRLDKQQVGSAPPECPRWMHHRPGVYCGACKKVQK